MGNASLWRDLGVCLSLANLLYLGVWTMILPLDVTQTYYLPGGALSPAFFLRPVGACVATALILFGLGRAVRGLGSARLRAFARAGFLFSALCALNAVRHLIPAVLGLGLADAMGRTGLAMAAIPGMALAVLVVSRWSREVVHAMSVLLLLCLPFFPVTIMRAFRNAVTCRSLDEARFADRAYRPSSLQPLSSSPRVVVLVFDEMDQRRLPPGGGVKVPLPAIEALQKIALWTEKASAPAEMTLQSVPALFSGLRVEVGRPSAPDELELTRAADGGIVPWSAQPNPFKVVRSLGQKAALVGWLNPYCRIFGEDLASCTWLSNVPYPDVGFSRDLLRQAVLMAETIPGVARLELPDRLDLPRPPLVPPQWHVRQYRRTHEQALRLVGDPQYALVFLHYPVPHAPFIYSQSTGTMLSADASYDGNLALADRTLAELRARMTLDGLWDDSILLLTSDHGWRELSRPALNVPFVLKMAGQTGSLHYDRPFETSVLADLLTELLTGRLKDAEAVARWLDRHGDAPVPPGKG